jgi:hypothetical protein
MNGNRLCRQDLGIPCGNGTGEQMNTALPVEPFEVMEKSDVVLNTMPVGLPGWPLAAGGIVTTSDCTTPFPSYSEDFCVLLSDTHTSPVGLNAIPQPFCRFGSTFGAATPPFDTRTVSLNVPATGAGMLLCELPPHATRPCD